MAEIIIDKKIPTPTMRGKDPEVMAAFKQMEIGDSFFYPDTRDSFRGNCYWRAGYVGIKVTIRRVTENDIEGVRVWRVS